MKYPCGIIKDLLPLYVDDVCNDESKEAVRSHLTVCESCKKCCEAMRSADKFVPQKTPCSEDDKMADSLKTIKHKIDKKIRNIIICAACAVIVLLLGFNLLFEIPILNVSPSDVSISADVYSLNELAQNSTDTDLSAGITKVQIPNIGSIEMSDKTMEESKFVSVLNISSEYFIKNIAKETVDGTMYLSSIKTTLLNNKAKVYQKSFNALEFGEINTIVYRDKNGTEIVLWSR